MIRAFAFRRLLGVRFGEWNPTFIVAAYYLLIVAIAGFLLPVVNEVPADFPAVVLWEFRMASLGAQWLEGEKVMDRSSILVTHPSIVCAPIVYAIDVPRSRSGASMLRRFLSLV
jgi:hypothetical protein